VKEEKYEIGFISTDGELNVTNIDVPKNQQLGLLKKNDHFKKTQVLNPKFSFKYSLETDILIAGVF
tara:strand:- start:881 stop:1078 length:198 start_codon:yes stop_codon:yes gene_type:complete